MELNLEEIKAAAITAMPGPWYLDKDGDQAWITDADRAVARVMLSRDKGPENAAYIAAANPAVVLALVERLERAERISQYAFWFTSVDEFDDLCPAEVLAGAGLSQRVEDLTAAQRRHLELPPIERCKMIKQYVARPTGRDMIS